MFLGVHNNLTEQVKDHATDRLPTTMFPPARSRRASVRIGFTPKPNKPVQRSATMTKKKGHTSTAKRGQSAKGSATSTAPAAALPVQPAAKKKIIGVRRILARDGDEEDLTEDPKAYEHGINNPIIAR